ncbi:MAG: hypothetical protein E6I85_04830 [Chloroflexi bacterium]|nr:MAG: hypothetical protein E6I85_04830 [Chloroflexota bacterium]
MSHSILGRQPLRPEAVHDLDSRRVVGDGQVRVAAGAGCPSHLQDGRAAVRPIGVAVQVALQLSRVDARGGFDRRLLADLLAELVEITAVPRLEQLDQYLGDA